LVASLLLLDTTNQFLLLKANYRVLILEYGRMENLTAIQPEVMHHIWIQGVVVFVVQMYFIRRIYTFAKTNARARANMGIVMTFFAILVVLTVWQIIGTVVFEVYGYGQPIFALASAREVAINISCRATAVGVDVAVAICMIYLLNLQTPRFKNSKQVIRRLLLVTVGSGAFTAVLAVVALSLVAHYPHTLYFAIFEYTLCSVYFSTLLANLNSRDYVKGEGRINTLSDFTTSTGRGTTLARAIGSDGLGNTIQGSDVFVKIDHDKVTRTDEPDPYAPRKV